MTLVDNRPACRSTSLAEAQAGNPALVTVGAGTISPSWAGGVLSVKERPVDVLKFSRKWAFFQSESAEGEVSSRASSCR